MRGGRGRNGVRVPIVMRPGARVQKICAVCYAFIWCVLREATPTVCGVYVVCFIKLASEGGAAARALDIAPPLSARCRGISRFRPRVRLYTPRKYGFPAARPRRGYAQVSGRVLCRAAGQLRETRPKRALARVSALRTNLSCARRVHPPPCVRPALADVKDLGAPPYLHSLCWHCVCVCVCVVDRDECLPSGTVSQERRQVPR